MTKMQAGTADVTNSGNGKTYKNIKQSNIKDNYKEQINLV